MSELRAKVVLLLGLGNTEAAADLIIEVVMASARKAIAEADELEAVREYERTRKRLKRERDKLSAAQGQTRDIEGTSKGRDGDKPGLVPPNPPSGSLSDPDLFPDLGADPDPDAIDIGPAGPITRYSSAFIEFWVAYPSKVGKEAAWKAWKKHKPQLPAVMAALAWQRTTKQWRDGIIPNPATYLNQHRWEDERRDITGTKPPVKYRPDGTEASPLDVFCQHHLRNVGVSPAPKVGCPDCATNQPSKEADPMPSWAR